MSRAVAIALIATVLASCSSNGSTKDLPPIGKPHAVSSIEQVTWPLAEYLQTTTELEHQEKARGLLLEECTSQYGEKYVPTAGFETTALLSPYRFGPVDLRTVAQYGYHDPNNDLSVAYSRAHSFRPPKGRPTSKLILDGPSEGSSPAPRDAQGKPVPRGGCDLIVENKLVKPPDSQNVVSASLERLDSEERTDSRVKLAIRKWSKCMSGKGYNYDGPSTPGIKFGMASKITTDEVSVAVADVDCRVTTNYIGVRVGIFAVYQQELIDDQSEIWAAYKAWKDRRTAKVEKVLANHGDQ